MKLTLDDYKCRFPHRPLPAPIDYAGQWVAWNADRTEIVAHGKRLEQVYREATAVGCARPVMQKITGAAFVGTGMNRA